MSMFLDTVYRFIGLWASNELAVNYVCVFCLFLAVFIFIMSFWLKLRNILFPINLQWYNITLSLTFWRDQTLVSVIVFILFKATVWDQFVRKTRERDCGVRLRILILLGLHVLLLHKCLCKWVELSAASSFTQLFV